MKHMAINQLIVGEMQSIQGFVRYVRDKRTMLFLVVSDRSGEIQVTVDKVAVPLVAQAAAELTIGSVVTLYGKTVENPAIKLNGVEFIPDKLIVESLADALPIQENAAIDLRMDYRWIDLRGEKQRLVFEVQTALVAALREFLLENNFIEIHTPKLIQAASESGAEVFSVEYFGEKAFLAQSPQFYKQMAIAGGSERVFECGPVFRAEKSHTNRHATEFTGFDLEFSGIESYLDVMMLEEELLTFALERVCVKHGEMIKKLYGLEVAVPARPFPVIQLHELYAELEKRYGLVVPESERNDLTAEAEQLSYRYAMDVFEHEFLFVTDYPAEKRAFYHMRLDGVPQGYDLLWRGVEITTGAQREHRYEWLIAQAAEKGLAKDVMFYTEFFRYGCPPHGGFGLGVDRLTMLLLGISIKEAMFLFRGPNRLTP